MKTQLLWIWRTFLGALVAFLTPAALHSQTVLFANVQTTVGSGLSFPRAVAVDGAGDVFIADPGNNRVVEVPANGGAQTTVGSGLGAPAGVAVDSAGNVFIADPGNDRVVEVPASGGVQTTVVSGLSSPLAVAVDGTGDLFIADTLNSRVVEVPAGGGAQTTVGSGLSWPGDVAVDGAGDVFIADTNNHRVVEVPAGGGAQTTVATEQFPVSGVAVDGAGDVFIADSFNNRVLELLAGGGETLVGSGLKFPERVAVDGAGNVFIADSANNRVVEVQRIAVNAGSVNIGSGASLTLTYNVTAGGTLGSINVVTQGAPNLDFILAGGSTCTGDVIAGSSCIVNMTFAPRAPGLRMGAVELTDSSGNVLATTFVYGKGLGSAVSFGPGTQTTVGSGLSVPTAVAVDAAGDVFISGSANSSVVKVLAGSGAQTTVGSGLYIPNGVAVDGAGNVFIADPANDSVVKVPAGGGAQTTVGSGLSGPQGVAVDGAGNLFIADTDNSRVLKVPPVGGGAQTTVGSGLSGPQGVAVDEVGDVFIADFGNNRVVEVPAGGGAQTTVGSGLYLPLGVAVDAAGDVFIADSGNGRVVEVPAGGGAQTTVGSGLNDPSGVAVDGAGNVFIADARNNRVVELLRSQAPTLSFAATAVGSTSSDSPQAVTVQNIGNQALDSVTPGLSLNGANSPSFAQVAGTGTPADCTATFLLAPGASCNLSFSFTPQSGGNLQGTAVLTDNALNGNPATQSIGLTGTGLQLSQTITFNAIPNQVQGGAVSLVASASSGLPVSFASLTATVCTVSGTTAMLVNPGTCTIQGSQPGNAQYAAAPSVNQSFAVTPAANFTISPIPPAEVVYRERLGGVILKLQSVNGFNGNVALSCSGGPSGTKCADLPGTVHVNGTAYAVSGVLFPKKAPDDTYIITFTGVSGSLSNSTTAKFTLK